eukprot:6533541-Pyramimonas_sp.AAC.2
MTIRPPSATVALLPSIHRLPSHRCGVQRTERKEHDSQQCPRTAATILVACAVPSRPSASSKSGILSHLLSLSPQRLSLKAPALGTRGAQCDTTG